MTILIVSLIINLLLFAFQVPSMLQYASVERDI